MLHINANVLDLPEYLLRAWPFRLWSHLRGAKATATLAQLCINLAENTPAPVAPLGEHLFKRLSITVMPTRNKRSAKS